MRSSSAGVVMRDCSRRYCCFRAKSGSINEPCRQERVIRAILPAPKVDSPLESQTREFRISRRSRPRRRKRDKVSSTNQCLWEAHATACISQRRARLRVITEMRLHHCHRLSCVPWATSASQHNNKGSRRSAPLSRPLLVPA